MCRSLALLSAALLIIVCSSSVCFSEPMPPPQAPAGISWLPHGYGGDMLVQTSVCTTQKGLWGFRTSPSHIGSWSQPLWGWDVNGYYRGPNVPEIDPVTCQLPIGLIYPDNSPPIPPAQGPRKVR